MKDFLKISEDRYVLPGVGYICVFRNVWEAVPSPATGFERREYPDTDQGLKDAMEYMLLIEEFFSYRK
jgi:hypothetical protein